jgi:hypothetical protein
MTARITSLIVRSCSNAQSKFSTARLTTTLVCVKMRLQRHLLCETGAMRHVQTHVLHLGKTPLEFR